MYKLIHIILMLTLAGISGAIGACIRFDLTEALKKRTTFPAGILISNVAGTFIMAFLFLAISKEMVVHIEKSESILWIINTGFLGGLTTFSTFTYDSLRLLEQKKWVTAALNIGANFFLSLLSIFAALYIVLLI